MDVKYYIPSQHSPDPYTGATITMDGGVADFGAAADAVQHNAQDLRTPKHVRASIAMDGGVADTTCYYTRRLELLSCSTQRAVTFGI